jgi:hypothetical protein
VVAGERPARVRLITRYGWRHGPLQKAERRKVVPYNSASVADAKLKML